MGKIKTVKSVCNPAVDDQGLDNYCEGRGGEKVSEIRDTEVIMENITYDISGLFFKFQEVC